MCASDEQQEDTQREISLIGLLMGSAADQPSWRDYERNRAG